MENNNQNTDLIQQKKKIIWSISSWAIAFVLATLTLRQFLEYTKWRDIYSIFESSVLSSGEDQHTILDTNLLLYPILSLLFLILSRILYNHSNQQ